MRQAGRAAAFWLMAGLFSLTAPGLSQGEIVGATRQGGWHVTFALHEPSGQTASDAWQAALTISLSGKHISDREEIVAIVGGTLFTRVMVPTEPGGEPGSREISLPIHAASLPKDAAGHSGTVENPALLFHRVDVVFARLRGMRAVPFLKRSVYLTTGPRPARKAGTKTEDAPAVAPETPPQPEPAVSPDPNPPPGIERPPVAPVQEGAVRETDLTPQPLTSFQDYWQDVQQRITMQFGQLRGARGTTADRKPRVEFRLHWNGIAQIIFLEQSSGNPQTDRAGLDSVVQAHPFPEFPPEVADAYVDVHVNFSDAKLPSASKRRRAR